MTYTARPSKSKGDINRAGRALISLNVDTADYWKALKVVNEWRTCHAYPLNTFKTTLRRKAQKYSGSVVAQRLKRLPTIVDKLERFPGMNLSQMQDIGGLRAIMNNVDEVKKLQAEYIEGGRFTHELIRENDYIEIPKPDGYRGVHLVYRYKNTLARNGLAEAYEGLSVELQLRSELQHTWATAVETVGTLKGESFKTGRGGKEWREFFSLVSSAFAIVEDTPVLSQHSDTAPTEIYTKIKKLEFQLNLIDNLMGLSAAASFVHDQKEAGYYNIIILDFINKRIRILPFSKSDLNEATNKYAELELEARPGTDTVLVSVGDIKSLKAAYPNYFLDIKDFFEKIKVIIELAE